MFNHYFLNLLLLSIPLIVPILLFNNIVKNNRDRIGSLTITNAILGPVAFTFLNITFLYYNNFIPLIAGILCLLGIATSFLTLYGYGFLNIIDDNPFEITGLLGGILGISLVLLIEFLHIEVWGYGVPIGLESYTILAPVILCLGVFLRQGRVIRTGAFFTLLSNGLSFIVGTWVMSISQTMTIGILIGSGSFIFTLISIIRIRRNQTGWSDTVSATSLEKIVTRQPVEVIAPSIHTSSESTESEPSSSRSPIIAITSGYDFAGESLKLGVKVANNGKLSIMNVTVNLDVPDGFLFERGTMPSQKLGNVAGGAFQSAIFWLKPQRCVDDEYGGSIVFRDASNQTHTIPIPRKKIVNVCPMLGPTDRVDDVFKKLKFGSLKRNCASFKFNGTPKTAFALAEARLKGLQPVDRSEQDFSDGTYLGYSCYIGQTKFGDEHFAAEIQASGSDANGVLTLSVYSDDERILSGFFADIMPEVREHIQVMEEQVCKLATCPKCSADIDPTKIGENRIYTCPYCNGLSKIAPWMV